MGYVYLVRNGDLFKIGRTENLQRRLKQLQPGHLIQAAQTDRSRDLEYELHARFKGVRIPQTEYFRLNDYQVEQVRIALGWAKPKPIPPVVKQTTEVVKSKPEEWKEQASISDQVNKSNHNCKVAGTNEYSRYTDPKTNYSNSDWYKQQRIEREREIKKQEERRQEQLIQRKAERRKEKFLRDYEAAKKAKADAAKESKESEDAIPPLDVGAFERWRQQLSLSKQFFNSNKEKD